MKFLLVLALAALLSRCALTFKPARVGDLLLSIDSPAEGDAVSGLVFLLNQNTLYIRDFQYGILGVDAEFCAGGSSLNTDDAYTVDFRLNEDDVDPSPIPGTGFSSADLELSLPEGRTLAEVAWFGLCRASDTTSVLASVIVLPQVVSNVPCNTTLIGELPNGTHGTAGRVYLLDRITFAVIGFSYDGQALDAFFWVGPGDTPSIQGYPCSYGDNIVSRLPAFSDQDVVVHVPEDAEGTEISHFALYCRSNNEDLVHIPIEEGLIPFIPPPTTPSDGFIGNLRTRDHRVSGAVYALDESTLMIEDFNYDGGAPGAVFYAVRGPNVRSSPSYIIPDETGSTAPLGAYRDRTIVLTLPSSITLHTIDWFLVWCDPFNINFGEVAIPDDVTFAMGAGDIVISTLPPRQECTPLESEVEMNCKMFGDSDNIAVSWAIDSTNDFITIQICGCVLPDNYIAFGLSGSDTGVQMVGGDVTWTWLDNEGVHAEDLDLTAYEQCLISGDGSQTGACPDTTNNVFSVSGFRDGCTTCIKFARPLNSSDPRDKPILLGQEQYVIWSMGPVGSLATPDGDTIPVPFRHFANANPSANLLLDFNRTAVDECDLQCSMCEQVLEPWPRPILEHTTTINARIGQSGSERGYKGITGTAGWGISWYLNGLLIPSVTVFRGTTYTFTVEGGEDPEDSSRYHPFYITDNDRGGYLFKSAEEQEQETVFAGLVGTTPLGVGRYCEYQNRDTDRSAEFDTFDEYVSTLVLECDPGSAGSFSWTPDENTPDSVYYQCATHQFLGWTVSVEDGGLPGAVVSTLVLTVALLIALFSIA